MPIGVAQEMLKGAHSRLVKAGLDPAIIDIEAIREPDANVIGSGSGITIWAETESGATIAGSAVGSPKKSGYPVGERAAYELISNLDHGQFYSYYFDCWLTLTRWLCGRISASKILGGISIDAY